MDDTYSGCYDTFIERTIESHREEQKALHDAPQFVFSLGDKDPCSYLDTYRMIYGSLTYNNAYDYIVSAYDGIYSPIERHQPEGTECSKPVEKKEEDVTEFFFGKP